MSKTPKRNESSSEIKLSPFRPTSSPRINKNDQFVLTKQITTFSKEIIECHTKWMVAHERGNVLCSKIESIKEPLLDTRDESQTLFPDELESPCEKLKVITTIFEDVIEKLVEQKAALLAIQIVAENENSKRKLFKTWPMNKMIELIDKLINAYKAEYDVKIKVMQNIAHSNSKNELKFHCCVWEHPCYVNENIILYLKMLKYECSFEK